MEHNIHILLIAPNVTEQMGGEGIKALHIFQELKRLHPKTIQITHARNRRELDDRLKESGVFYVEDTRVSFFLVKHAVVRWLLNSWFSFKAVRLAERLAYELSDDGSACILWQTEPNSPVSYRFASRAHFNCLGPINGNIYFPPAFRRFEGLAPSLRRRFHGMAQRVNRWWFRSGIRAELILCAGGDRTRTSLKLRGCKERDLLDTLDCGIKDSLLEYSQAEHVGENLDFVHYRAGTFHKGTFLAIESLTKTKRPVRLHVIGRGKDVETCKALVEKLGLRDRVTFTGWFENHSALFDTLRKCRALVLPTIEDANGIAVQEAMAVGLPAVCLDWGGPQLLVKHGVSGFLVKPDSIGQVTDELAKYMDLLAVDDRLASAMGKAARESAHDWRWSQVMADWLTVVGERYGSWIVDRRRDAKEESLGRLQA